VWLSCSEGWSSVYSQPHIADSVGGVKVEDFLMMTYRYEVI